MGGGEQWEEKAHIKKARSMPVKDSVRGWQIIQHFTNLWMGKLLVSHCLYDSLTVVRVRSLNLVLQSKNQDVTGLVPSGDTRSGGRWVEFILFFSQLLEATNIPWFMAISTPISTSVVTWPSSISYFLASLL